MKGELKEGWFVNRRVATLIVGALAFVVAFGINSTAQAFFKEHIGELERTGAWFVYTLIAFIFAIIVINLFFYYLV